MGGATLPRMTRHAGFLRLHLRDSGEKAPLSTCLVAERLLKKAGCEIDCTENTIFDEKTSSSGTGQQTTIMQKNAVIMRI